MSQLAEQHHAINLSQGFPDFDCDPALQALVTKYMAAGMNQYPPLAGVPKLREAIASKVQTLYGAAYDPESQITVTPGATYAIYTTIAAFVSAGDEVIVFEPAYDSYAPAIELHGGVPIYVTLKLPDYRIDWNEVERAITRNTRMILINTPNNPTASTFSVADMRELERLTRDTDIIILSDEVYEHIVFDGAQHQSVARFPELASRAIIASSFGKTYHVTGWKMGYCLAPKELMTEFRKVHQFNVFTCNAPVQYALAEYMQSQHHHLELAAFYQNKRDYFRAALRESRFQLLNVAGTYFQCVDYGAITDENDVDYAVRLTRDHGVAAIPLSAFYHKPPQHKLLRLCFAKKEETLLKAVEILRIV